MQPELMSISSGTNGIPSFVGRFTIDTHHTPGYAAGYMANQINPRLFMTTHMAFDTWQNEEAVAEVRHHWKGLYHFGAPDGVVVNLTKDDIWVRDGILPDYPNSRVPQYDFDDCVLVVPGPPTSRAEIQEPGIRESEVPPSDYYPEGYEPLLLTEWPVDGDLVVPLELFPESLRNGMGQNWRAKKKYEAEMARRAAEGDS